MTNNLQPCVEELHFYSIKHHNYLFMNKKILKDLEKVPFKKDVKCKVRDSNGKLRILGDTNVRALQTETRIESTSFSLLRKWICDTITNATETCDFGIGSDWAALYNKGDHTISHQHIPASFAFVYFIKSPIGSSPLVFSTSNTIIEPEEGKLVIFPGELKHHVPKNECDGRMVFSGNLFPFW